jgi:hypothetical protein
MPSYRGDPSFDLSGRDHPPTKSEWVVAGIAVIVGLLMLGISIFDDSGPRWLHDLRSLPMALLMFALAFINFKRARADRPGEQYSSRALRWMALLFLMIGALMVALTVMTLKGAF